MKRFLSVFAPLVLGIAFVGCSSDHPTATVTGSVKLEDGKAVAGGLISFFHESDKGTPGSATIAKDGTYKVTAPVGKCKVVVSPPPPPGKGAGEVGGAEAGANVDIPENYRAKEKTPLGFEVKTGTNAAFDIVIKK